MNRHGMVRTAQRLALILGTATLLASRTQAADTGDAWHEERAKLEAIINERVKAEVGRKINRREFAARLKLDWPVNPATRTRQEVEAEVERRIGDAVDKKFPPGSEERYRQESAEKFPLYKAGQDVSFTIRGGRGPNTFVNGTLHQVTPIRLRVGNRWISRGDMAEEDLAKFDAETNAEQIERYVRVALVREGMQKEDYARELENQTRAQVYLDSGYVLVQNRFWVPKDEFLERYVQHVSAQEEKAIRPTVEEEVFTANGYVKNEDSGEWMPKKVSDSFTARLRSLIGRRDAPPPPPADGTEFPPDMPPPPPNGGPFDDAPPPPDGGLPPGMQPPPPRTPAHDLFDENQ